MRESESAALRRLLSAQAPRLATSVVSEIEARRAVRRAGGRAEASRLEELLARLDLIGLTAPIRRLAGELDPPELRSFDAAHLATALSLAPDLDAFVCYDLRLAAAAQHHGLPVLAPVP